MSRLSETLHAWVFGAPAPRPSVARRPRRTVLTCDTLEGRVTPSHFGGGLPAGAIAAFHRGPRGGGGGGGAVGGDNGGTTNTALQTALTTLRNDVNTILSTSNVTVAQLNAINTAFRTLRTDGLQPTSRSALASFQDRLVTTYASGTAVVGNQALLDEFKALYTSTPTDQQTTDLTNAYNALATAVTSANITQANIDTVNTDFAAVLAARGNSTSTGTTTPTFPYFSLVTGQGGIPGVGGGHRGRR